MGGITWMSGAQLANSDCACQSSNSSITISYDSTKSVVCWFYFKLPWATVTSPILVSNTTHNAIGSYCPYSLVSYQFTSKSEHIQSWTTVAPILNSFHWCTCIFYFWVISWILPYCSTHSCLFYCISSLILHPIIVFDNLLDLSHLPCKLGELLDCFLFCQQAWHSMFQSHVSP